MVGNAAVCAISSRRRAHACRQVPAHSCGELTRNLYQLRHATLEVADREALTPSIAATHALSFVFFPSWIRTHVLFGTLGPVNLISDTLEACEEIMLRGEADVLLCHYHRGAGIRLEPSHFTSVVVGRDVLLPLSAPGSKGAPQWTLPGHSEYTGAVPVLWPKVRPWPDPRRGLGKGEGSVFVAETLHSPASDRVVVYGAAGSGCYVAPTDSRRGGHRSWSLG